METTKKKTKLLKSVPMEIQRIFNYVVKKGFTGLTTLHNLRRLAENEYLPKLTGLNSENYLNYVKKIKDFDFGNVNNYTCCDEITQENSQLLWGLDCFRVELLIEIERKFDKDWKKNHKQYILVRQVSPPLSAYDIPLDKKPIKESKRDYGLLFE